MGRVPHYVPKDGSNLVSTAHLAQELHHVMSDKVSIQPHWKQPTNRSNQVSHSGAYLTRQASSSILSCLICFSLQSCAHRTSRPRNLFNLVQFLMYDKDRAGVLVCCGSGAWSGGCGMVSGVCRSDGVTTARFRHVQDEFHHWSCQVSAYCRSYLILFLGPTSFYPTQ